MSENPIHAEIAQRVSSFVVHQWHCDHLGHMNVRHYAAVFDDAIFIFWGTCGLDAAKSGPVPVTAELKIDFRQEALPGTIVAIDGAAVRVGKKSVGLRFTMRAGDTELSVCEVTEVFVDPVTHKSCEIPDRVRRSLTDDWANSVVATTS